MMDLLGAGNPYVKRYADGGEVQPPPPPVVNVGLNWFKDPGMWNQPDFQKGVQAYGSVAAFKSALEKYNRDHAQYVIDFHENEFNRGRSTPGRLAGAYEMAATSPWFSEQERETFLAKAVPLNEQMRQITEANRAIRAADRIIDERLTAFSPVKKQLLDQAQQQNVEQKKYINEQFEKQRKALVEQYLNPNAMDQRSYDRYRKELTNKTKADIEAVQQGLKQNRDYLRSVQELMRSQDVDLSSLVLPYLFTRPEEVAPSEPPPAVVQPVTPPEQTTPVRPPIPVPVIPQTPTSSTVPSPSITPSIPSGNLTPMPLPIGGIPQPSFGYQPPSYESIFPGYQSPTAQAAPTMQQQQQQQIQYGPIGQAATSSSDLLKNLLASTQQSMPFDFTANNPYLMKQEPVQFFADGGEVQPPAAPVVNVDLSWFNNPSLQNEPAFQQGVQAYGSVAAFKNALESYRRDYDRYQAAFAEKEFREGRSVPGTLASTYEQLSKSPFLSAGERSNYAAQVPTLLAQQEALDKRNQEERAAFDVVLDRFRAYNPVETQLSQQAYDMHSQEKNYIQSKYATEKQGISQIGDRALRAKMLQDLNARMTAEEDAAVRGLEQNIAFIADTRERLRGGDIDLSKITLPHLFTVPEPVPVPEPQPTLVQPTPAPAPTPTTPVPSPIPVPGIPQTPSTSVPAPSITTPTLTTPSVPVSNLTPRPLPVGGIPQPTFGSLSVLPQYQSPTTQAMQPTNQQQQPQQQIQYGPIGQGAVGQASLLSTLLSQQQDPTKVSLLGFDNPYLMKPFG
jgi:hypothetical protein